MFAGAYTDAWRWAQWVFVESHPSRTTHPALPGATPRASDEPITAAVAVSEAPSQVEFNLIQNYRQLFMLVSDS